MARSVGQRPSPASKPDFKGCLWRLNEKEQSWTQLYFLLSNNQLFGFSDKDQGTLVFETIVQGQLTEVSLNPSANRYKKGLRVSGLARVFEEGAAAEAAGTLELERRPQSCVLAADDATEHAAWLRHLRRALNGHNGNGHKNGGLSQRHAVQDFAFRPSMLVVSKLCSAGREQGAELLKMVRSTRRSFETGLRVPENLREEGKNTQRQLFHVQSTLMALEQTLAAAHTSMESQTVEDAAALQGCRAWLTNMTSFVLDVDARMDALLHREGGPFVADWSEFAQNTAVQLRDVEEAMQAGQILEMQQQATGAVSDASDLAPPLSRARCAAVPRASMPYNTYWARKIAI